MKAFPQAIKESYFDSGMDLRDYFAAKAMQVAIDKMSLADKDQEEILESIALRCQMAYLIADAMMKERESNG